MRVSFACLGVCLVLLCSLDAGARSRAAAQGPYTLAVAPFDGEKAGGRALAEMLELELEEVETVVVQGDRWLRSDLRRAGDDGWQREPLARILRKRDIQILVRGRMLGGGLEVVAFGDDGRPRFRARFDTPENLDRSAKAIAARLGPALLKWGATRPLVERDGPQEGAATPVDEQERLFVEKREVSGAPAERAIAATTADPLDSARDEVPRFLEDPPSPGRDEPRGSQRGKRSTGRRLLISEDEPEEPPSRITTVSDLPEVAPSRRVVQTMAQAEKELAAPRLPLLLVSGAGTVGGWSYGFTAIDKQDDFERRYISYGGGLRLASWLLPYVGVDAHLDVQTYRVSTAPEPVTPKQLTVIAPYGGIVLRGGFPFIVDGSVLSPGLRVGYRYWGSFVDVQTNTEDNLGYTLIPGWQLHAVSVGFEGTLAYRGAPFPVDIEVRLEALPLVRYLELPDNPAQTAVPVGGSGDLIIRLPVYKSVFVEAAGGMTFVFIDWSGGPGTRRSTNRIDEEGNRLLINGGESLNLRFGGTIGVGLSF